MLKRKTKTSLGTDNAESLEEKARRSFGTDAMRVKKKADKYMPGESKKEDTPCFRRQKQNKTVLWVTSQSGVMGED